MAEFKKISDVDVINTLTENDNVLIVGDDGALKQTSSDNMGGRGLIVKPVICDEGNDGDLVAENNYDEIYDALVKGRIVYFDLAEVYVNQGGSGRWVNCSFGSYPSISNEGNAAELVVQWSITDQGLVVSLYDFRILFPNGSHNLPSKTIEK